MSAHDILFLLYVIQEINNQHRCTSCSRDEPWIRQDLVAQAQEILGAAYERVYGSQKPEHPVDF